MAASPTVDIGTGITILFGTSSFTSEILDVRLPSPKRESVPTSHQGTTGAYTFTPTDLYDAGEFGFDFHFNPDKDPPISGAAETITITFPSTATWVFSGFMTDYSPLAPFEGKMTGSATCKLSGKVTVTAAT